MAYTCKIITALPSEIAASVKAYLDGETITNLYSLTAFKYGMFVSVFVCFD